MRRSGAASDAGGAREPDAGARVGAWIAGWSRPGAGGLRLSFLGSPGSWAGSLGLRFLWVFIIFFLF